MVHSDILEPFCGLPALLPWLQWPLLLPQAPLQRTALGLLGLFVFWGLKLEVPTVCPHLWVGLSQQWTGVQVIVQRCAVSGKNSEAKLNSRVIRNDS